MVALGVSAEAIAQAGGTGRGTLIGIIHDGTVNEPLAFASVGIPNLNAGATTELDGSYRLPNLPGGIHEVQISYLGYETLTLTVNIEPGKETRLDTTLLQGGVTIEEVVVTTQAIGQRAAIMQQISSNTIVNVVSKERLQELPDQNAAESVGRLAGVSIQRDGGEGQRVVVRGMSPRFSNITVNGVRIPSTDAQDRSVDLSMISPDMLSGIELFKALRPDMDGDAIGGAVNFTARTAPRDFELDARVFKGYNGHERNFVPLRANLSVSNRFKDDKFGLILTANYQKADRSSDGLNVDYSYGGINPDGSFKLRVDDFNLSDQLETRTRSGVGLTFDYNPSARHTVIFSSNYSRTDRDELRRRRRYRAEAAYQEYDIRERETNIDLFSNTINGDHRLGKRLNLKWLGAYAATRQRTPYELNMRFREVSAQAAGIVLDQGPDAVIPGYFNNINQTYIQDVNFDQSLTAESNTTLRLDLQYDFTLAETSSGFFKTGLSYRATRRNRDNEGLVIRPYLAAENPVLLNDDRELFVTDGSGRALIANFLGSDDIRPFLNGDYDFGPGTAGQRDTLLTPIPDNIDLAAYNAFFGVNYAPGESLGYGSQLDIEKVRAFYERYKGLFNPNDFANQEDYEANEDVYGAYVMAQLNLGKAWMLMGGLRYEDTRQNYLSVNAPPRDEDAGGTGFGNLIDVKAAQGYGEWLPMVHLRYKPTAWFDARFAVTKSLARPNFLNLVPWERINDTDRTIDRGRPDLKHTEAWNYDAYFSFYNNYGLFTIGLFQKDFINVDYVRTYGLLEPGNRFNGYLITEPENVPESRVRGIEFDLQGNFAQFSRSFWKGMILGANLTFASSATLYPFSFTRRDTTILTVPPFIRINTVAVDTLRSGRNAGQANIIANFTLGYELGRFSARLTAIYQDNAFNNLGARGELDGFTDESLRWDLSATCWVDQKRRWQLILNLNNISNQPEQSFVGNTRFPSEREFYGFTADLGLRYRIR